MKTLFYTVSQNAPGFPVQYIDPTTLTVETFTGSGFCDPGQASQEFQACMPGLHYYLEMPNFQYEVVVATAWKELQAVPSYIETQARAFVQEA